jgi:hypothetical protein
LRHLKNRFRISAEIAAASQQAAGVPLNVGPSGDYDQDESVQQGAPLSAKRMDA